MHPAPCHGLLPLLIALLMSAIGVAQNAYWIDRGQAPSGQCGGAMVYDEARGVTLLVGTNGCNETQSWNGSQWTLLGPAPTPSLWLTHLAYDSMRQVVVAVVGNQSTGVATYEWNGTSWALRDTGGIPARGNFSITYDAARGVTLLFGGNQGGNPGYADLWQWDGVGWTLIYIGGPTPRWNVQLTYDAQRQTVLLFGGYGQWQGQQSQHLGDTWEWNGSHWAQHFGIASPPARRSAAFAFDSGRGKVVMVGGQTSAGLAQDTWEWDGTMWQQIAAPLPITGSSSAAYDSGRGVLTLMSQQHDATWEYFSANPTQASFATYGTGCPGPTGIPSLTNVPGSVPVLGSQLQLELSNLPTSPFNLPVGFIGFDAQSWNGQPLPLSLTPLGFTGCQVWLAPLLSEVLVNTGGTASWDITIPVNAFALGAHVYFQAAVLAAGWNPGGFVFTNAGDAVIGTP